MATRRRAGPRWAITTLIGLAVVLLVGPAAPVAVSQRRAFTLLAEHRVDPRVVDLTVESPALGTTAHARLLLPPGWSGDKRRWPVLYLLHGCCDTYLSWTRSTDVAALTAHTGVIVVMPEGGGAGFYSDWWNGGRGGAPAWETFHLVELRQLLESRYRAAGEWAVAGLSMGGLGAMVYAARHPGMFRAAASYSGLLHTTLDAGASANIMGLVAREGLDRYGLWGEPAAQADIWAAHNPYDLVPRLRGVRLFVSAGTGDPGPLDPSDAMFDRTERFVDAQSVAFARRAGELGLTLTTDFYGAGTHSWPYWQRELHRSFPTLMDSIGAPRLP